MHQSMQSGSIARAGKFALQPFHQRFIEAREELHDSIGRRNIGNGIGRSVTATTPEPRTPMFMPFLLSCEAIKPNDASDH
jgi:hypothetical protein